MKILNKDDIPRYLEGFVKQNPIVSSLVTAALRVPMERELTCLLEVTDAQNIPDKRLHKKFNERSYPWVLFHPQLAIAEDVKQVCLWIEDFFAQEQHHFDGPLKHKTRERLKKIKTLKDAVEATQRPLLTEKEIETALSERIILPDEKKGHIKWVSELSDHHHLFRIMTTTGMDSAGKRAKNCLWKSNSPDWYLPHRKRVNFSDRWHYYSIRNANNHPLMTISIDLQRAVVQYEPDHMLTRLRLDRTLSPDLQKLWGECLVQIKEIYPVFKQENTRIEWYDDTPPIPNQNTMGYFL